MVKKLVRWCTLKRMHLMGYVFGRVLSVGQVAKIAKARNR